MKTTTSILTDHLIESTILAIAAKLSAEALTKKTYTFHRAEKIISKCVLPSKLIKFLKSYETEIKEQL